MSRTLLLVAFSCLAIAGGASVGIPSPTTADPAPESTLSGEPTLIIAHRGASGVYPEHTKPAYELAIEQGADFIEPDLVMTKDGVLISRHDRYLSTTTNVSDRSEFADRKKTKITYAGARTDWWAEDFTLAEIKTLRARQPFEGRSKAHDDQHEVLTLDQVIQIALDAHAAGRTVGLHIEAKSPAHHAKIGLSMVDPILNAIEGARLQELGVPVFIQSFEQEFLAQAAEKTNLPLIQNLVGPPLGELFNDPKLEDITVAGVGANKTLILNKDGSSTDYIARAHALGLLVHVFTVRDDLIAPGFERVEDELTALMRAGADGVWTDFPDTAVQARAAMPAE